VVDPLQPILEKFVASAEGKVDRGFWDSIYKWRGPKGSGSPHVSGWIVKLFPYLDNPEAKYARLLGRESAASPLLQNPWLSAPPSAGGPLRDDFPSLPARAPFKWIIGPPPSNMEFSMEFIGGLIGISQDPATLCIRPEIGWAIREVGAVEQAAAFDRAVMRACRGSLW